MHPTPPDPGDMPELRILTTASDHTVWVDVAGEADASNDERLQSALAEVDLAGVDLVRVRLSDLAFCDVRALCHLLAFARRVKASGRAISVEGASGIIQKMSQLLGVDEDLRPR